MEKEKVPFKITPQILRILEDIIFIHDKYSFYGEQKDKIFYLIREALDSEDPKELANVRRFLGYLKKGDFVLEICDVNPDSIKSIAGEIPKEKLIAVARTHEENMSGGEATENFYNLPEDLEKIAQYTSTHSTGEKYIKKYIVLWILKITQIEIMLDSITSGEIYEFIEFEQEKTEESYQDSKVKFDPLNGVIRCGDEVLRFHRGERGDKPRLTLFKELWGLKRHIKNGKIKAEGEALPPEALAVRLNITIDASTFKRNQQAQERFFGLIKGINRQLKDKGMPAQIERNNGIQLVITEK